MENNCDCGKTCTCNEVSIDIRESTLKECLDIVNEERYKDFPDIRTIRDRILGLFNPKDNV